MSPFIVLVLWSASAWRKPEAPAACEAMLAFTARPPRARPHHRRRARESRGPATHGPPDRSAVSTPPPWVLPPDLRQVPVAERLRDHHGIGASGPDAADRSYADERGTRPNGKKGWQGARPGP
jgi:hypothetical protein